MTEFLLPHWGYVGLFAVSFLAATLAPLGSEAAVAAMTLAGFDPVLVFVTATTGNSLGALVNYWLGEWGGRFLLGRYVHLEGKSLEKAERTFEKWGAPALFFAWAPIIGDPLTVAAGVLRVNLAVFLFWVILGKGLRYLALILGVGGLGTP